MIMIMMIMMMMLVLCFFLIHAFWGDKAVNWGYFKSRSYITMCHTCSSKGEWERWEGESCMEWCCKLPALYSVSSWWMKYQHWVRVVEYYNVKRKYSQKTACPSQIPHSLAWDRTQTPAVTGCWPAAKQLLRTWWRRRSFKKVGTLNLAEKK